VISGNTFRVTTRIVTEAIRLPSTPHARTKATSAKGLSILQERTCFANMGLHYGRQITWIPQLASFPRHACSGSR
jgi:hypothetical protein